MKKNHSRQLESDLMQIFNTAADGMRVVDTSLNTLRVNKTFLKLSRSSSEQNLGKKCHEVFSGSLCNTPNCPVKQILKDEKRVEAEVEKTTRDGTRIPCIVTATPYYDIDGKLKGIVEDFKDIGDRKNAEEKIKKTNRELEETNITLKNVLAHIEQEKMAIQKNLTENLERNVKPLLHKLKKSNKVDRKALGLLENALNQLTSGFYQKLSSQRLKLTPTELKICQLIKNGYPAKEIAELSNLAYSTITHHKKQIRKKLGLKNSRINLVTYLNEMDV
jgi:PAS domain S-box-containing protein